MEIRGKETELGRAELEVDEEDVELGSVEVEAGGEYVGREERERSIAGV